jgi:hypothetical protein
VRYKGILSFEFPREYLPSASFEEVKAAIESVVAPQRVPASVGSKTISIGQTPEQVEATLGKPDKVVNLGPKQMYVYKDLKVTFIDGKVTDVQ